jgi:hypothetical protein
VKKLEQFHKSSESEKASLLSEAVPAIPANLAGQRYLSYPMVMALLSSKLKATPEELAAWVYLGPEEGGLAAYRHVNELRNTARFAYAECPDIRFHDFIIPLVSCWFVKDEVDTFSPKIRFITGESLISRWTPHVKEARAFIAGKIRESRLSGFHPIFGLTEISFDTQIGFAPLEACLFPLPEIKEIEVLDFALSELQLHNKQRGHLDHDLEMQQKANMIAAQYKISGRQVTKSKVAETLAAELGITPETVERRIRKRW